MAKRPLYNLLLKNLILNVKHYTTVNTLRTSSIHSSLSSTIFVPFTAEIKILCHGFTENTFQKVYHILFAVTNEVKIICFSITLFIMCFQLVLHFIEMALKKAPYATCSTPKNKINVASPAYKLHSNSQFLDPVSRLVVPKKTITVSTSHILYSWHDRNKTMASPKSLFSDIQILYFLHKPSWRFSKLFNVHSQKT